MPAGKGKEFVNDMEEFVKTISSELPKAFDNNDYENEKGRILQEFQDQRTELVEKLNKIAEKQGFKVKTTPNGIYFLPIINAGMPGMMRKKSQRLVIRKFCREKCESWIRNIRKNRDGYRNIWQSFPQWRKPERKI